MATNGLVAIRALTCTRHATRSPSVNVAQMEMELFIYLSGAQELKRINQLTLCRKD